MRHYTLAELASPKGAREFLNECEKPEESVLGSIVRKLERAIRGGTGWSDTELERIVQEEIEELIDSLNSQHAADLAALRGQVATLRGAVKVALNAAYAIMECNGYRCRDAMGTENSVWLGPRLSNITLTARAALAATAAPQSTEASHE